MPQMKLLPKPQSRQLAQLAEKARLSLSKYSGQDVEYGQVGLQMLDEWIDRHLKQFPKPNRSIVMLWGAFLGESFRRKFDGRWAIKTVDGKPHLGVVCPTRTKKVYFLDIMDQIQRRVRKGMSESLAFYYMTRGIEITTT